MLLFTKYFFFWVQWDDVNVRLFNYFKYKCEHPIGNVRTINLVPIYKIIRKIPSGNFHKHLAGKNRQAIESLTQTKITNTITSKYG